LLDDEALTDEQAALLFHQRQQERA
jgi:hypothetical protein